MEESSSPEISISPGLMSAPKSSVDGALTVSSVRCVLVVDKTWALEVLATNHTSETRYLGVDVYVNLEGFLGGASHRSEIFALSSGFDGEVCREFPLLAKPFSLGSVNEVRIQLRVPAMDALKLDPSASYQNAKNERLSAICRSGSHAL